MIHDDACAMPQRLRGVEAYVPAYWVIPAMCFLYRVGGRIAGPVEASSRMFYSFKLGQDAYAYPLAMGVHEALRRQVDMEFGAVLSVPLSPEKAAAGQLHRTRSLARELARLLGTVVVDELSLAVPVSRRGMRNAGATPSQFERAYRAALRTSGRLQRARRVLLVDDVGTRGSTLKVCAAELRAVYPMMSVVAATAGQMIVTDVVRNEAELRP